MENSYVSRLINSRTICIINDERTIITDKMGPWNNQLVVLTWEGNTNKGVVSLTPDEVEILFEKGLTSNVVREENGKLYRTFSYLDSRHFPRAIVCGVLAPSTRADLRPEIYSYAKKMGYVTETMTPVKMLNGTKSLLLNNDGTYSIFFAWHDDFLKKINHELLRKFTKNFFSNYSIEIKSNGVLLVNLTEDIAFSRQNIDIFRVYDIQLFYITPQFDKKLLLRAVMNRAFICSPCDMLRRGHFKKIGNIAIPEDRKGRLPLNEFGRYYMNCGTVYYNSEFDSYTYRITVPYTESIRELMIDTEKVLKAKYGKLVYVRFSGFKQDLSINCNGNDIGSDVERELTCLDYAMTLLREEDRFNEFQLYSSIISLLEADSSGKYMHEYYSYMETLKRVLPDKLELF